MGAGGKTQVKTGQKALGFGIAISLHLALLYVFAVSSSNGLPIEGLDGAGFDMMQGSEIAMDVSLVETTTHRSVPQRPQETSSFEKFMAMTEAASDLKVAPLEVSQPAAASLAEALGEDVFTPKGAETASGKTADASTSMVKVGGRDRKTPNDLWKAIEPCWRRLSDESSLSVSLEVAFSPLGNLAKPPVIKRDPGVALTDRVLRSESQAIAALAQCGPYLMAYGQSGVVVSFPRNN